MHDTYIHLGSIHTWGFVPSLQTEPHQTTQDDKQGPKRDHTIMYNDRLSWIKLLLKLCELMD